MSRLHRVKLESGSGIELDRRCRVDAVEFALGERRLAGRARTFCILAVDRLIGSPRLRGSCIAARRDDINEDDAVDDAIRTSVCHSSCLSLPFAEADAVDSDCSVAWSCSTKGRLRPEKDVSASVGVTGA